MYPISLKSADHLVLSTLRKRVFYVELMQDETFGPLIGHILLPLHRHVPFMDRQNKTVGGEQQSPEMKEVWTMAEKAITSERDRNDDLRRCFSGQMSGTAAPGDNPPDRRRLLGRRPSPGRQRPRYRV